MIYNARGNECAEVVSYSVIRAFGRIYYRFSRLFRINSLLFLTNSKNSSLFSNRFMWLFKKSSVQFHHFERMINDLSSGLKRYFKIRAGTPTATPKSGTSFVTTAPAPITAPLPIVTFGMIMAFAPIHTSLPITTNLFCEIKFFRWLPDVNLPYS
jgi:hypothetical protein